MTPGPEIGKIAKHFSRVKDPRIDRTKRHRLLDIIIIAISWSDLWGRRLGRHRVVWEN